MISDAAKARLGSIPSDFRRWWRPQDLANAYARLHDDIKAEGLIKEARLRVGHFRSFKELAEEVVPLFELGLWIQSEIPDALVEVKPNFDPMGRPDAVFRVDGVATNLEITQGLQPKEARNERLMIEALNDGGFASRSAVYERDKKTRKVVAIQHPIGCLASDEENRVVDAAIAGGKRKLRKAQDKPYLPGTSLLIWLDENILLELSDNARKQLSDGLRPVLSAFDRVYAMGPYTTPVVVEK